MARSKYVTVSIPATVNKTGFLDEMRATRKLIEDEMAFGYRLMMMSPPEAFMAKLRRAGWAEYGRADVAAEVAEGRYGRGHEWDEPVYLPYANISGYRNPREEW